MAVGALPERNLRGALGPALLLGSALRRPGGVCLEPPLVLVTPHRAALLSLLVCHWF